MGYVAFIHKEPESSFGISFPDFPGCISAADTLEEVLKNGAKALAFHVEGLKKDGLEIPEAQSIDDIYKDEEFKVWRKDTIVSYVPLFIECGAVKKIDVELDDGLLQAIDQTAKDLGFTRSAFLSSAARNEILGERLLSSNSSLSSQGNSTRK